MNGMNVILTNFKQKGHHHNIMQIMQWKNVQKYEKA